MSGCMNGWTRTTAMTTAVPAQIRLCWSRMVLIQHLFGIPSLRQTYREIQVNVAYRWFLGYGLLDNIPHFAT